MHHDSWCTFANVSDDEKHGRYWIRHFESSCTTSSYSLLEMSETVFDSNFETLSHNLSQTPRCTCSLRMLRISERNTTPRNRYVDVSHCFDVWLHPDGPERLKRRQTVMEAAGCASKLRPPLCRPMFPQQMWAQQMSMRCTLISNQELSCQKGADHDHEFLLQVWCPECSRHVCCVHSRHSELGRIRSQVIVCCRLFGRPVAITAMLYELHACVNAHFSCNINVWVLGRSIQWLAACYVATFEIPRSAYSVLQNRTLRQEGSCRRMEITWIPPHPCVHICSG